MTEFSKSEREQALARLRSQLKVGDTVYCILRHVSRSGMSRVIDFRISLDQSISWDIAKALNCPIDRDRRGLKVSGCGMDMGLAVVYELGRVLFPDGFKVDGIGRNGDTSGWDKDGGYALKHRWI